MYYILPAEAVAIHKAVQALAAIEKRCRSAGYPMPSNLLDGITETPQPHSYSDLLSMIRARDEQIRNNARIAAVVAECESLIRSMVIEAHTGDCTVAKELWANLRNPTWTGPQFSVKRREAS